MLKFSAVVLPCALLLAYPAMASSDGKGGDLIELHLSCGDAPTAYDRALCYFIEASPVRCAGSIEERLTCLENHVTHQQREIRRLKRDLYELTTPRIQPLTPPRLSQQ